MFDIYNPQPPKSQPPKPRVKMPNGVALIPFILVAGGFLLLTLAPTKASDNFFLFFLLMVIQGIGCIIGTISLIKWEASVISMIVLVLGIISNSLLGLLFFFLWCASGLASLPG